LDSISQFVLGAAVGEAVLGKKVGNSAPLWGGIAGTIPDLDILFYPLLDQIGRITFHRGISHSFLFLTLLTPIIAWLVYRFYKTEASWWDWSKLFFLAMITHPILDCFTTYGTQIFWPFSDQRVAFCSIFVADPVYTLPLLFSLVFILFRKKDSIKRRWINYAALAFSHAYLFFTLFNHAGVVKQFEKTAEAKGLNYSRVHVSPTPLNQVLWSGIVETEGGYHLGQYSLFDTQEQVDLEFYEQNENLLSEVSDRKIIDALKWFSDDFYVVSKDEEMVKLHDIRFGKAGDIKKDGGLFVFNFHMEKDPSGKWLVEEVIPREEFGSISDLFSTIYNRAKGN